MKKEILNIVKENIEKIDINVEQESLAKEFFDLSEILGLSVFYDLVMDAFLLAKHDKYDKDLCPRNKDELLIGLKSL